MTQRVQLGWRFVLVLLVLAIVVSSQVTAAIHNEQHDTSTHCCLLCHVGSFPLLQTSVAVAIEPVTAVGWIAASPDSGFPREALRPVTCSRAPPSA